MVAGDTRSGRSQLTRIRAQGLSDAYDQPVAQRSPTGGNAAVLCNVCAVRVCDEAMRLFGYFESSPTVTPGIIVVTTIIVRGFAALLRPPATSDGTHSRLCLRGRSCSREDARATIEGSKRPP
jgi:hypothetical protein